MKHLLAVCILLVVFATQATADNKVVRIECMPDIQVKETFALKHSERLISSSVTKNGQLLVVLGTKDLSDWTILVYDTYGNVCILLTGYNWSFQSEWEIGT